MQFYIKFFLSVILCFVSMGTRLPCPGGAAAARNGFACAVPGPDTGYPLQERLTRSRHTGSVLAQEGPAELKFPAQIFIGYIDCSYGAHEHLGGAFANFGSQVGFLCSDCAESDRIHYYALTSGHVRLMAPACVPSPPRTPASRRLQPQVH